MPNTEPLDDGDDAEGQLKPIAQFLTQRPDPVAAKPTPQPAPTVATRPAAAAAPQPAPTSAPKIAVSAPQSAHSTPTAQFTTPSVGGGTRRLKTSLHTPGLMINHRGESHTAEAVAEARAEVVRTTPYTDEQLNSAWQSFIDHHPEERILTNTMRVSRPVRTEKGYTITVENEDQVKIVHEAMPSILKYIGDIIMNDTVHIEILSNAGESSPMTWNERQVLRHIADNNSEFVYFFKSLKLNIN